MPLILSGLFGIGPATIERSSVAVYNPPTHTTSLLLSDSGSSELAVGGTAILRARGGIGVPSAAAGAATAGGSATIDAPIVRLAGAASAGLADRTTGTVKEAASVPANPYASMAQPLIEDGVGAPIVVDGAEVHVVAGQHAALAASSGTIVLEPGLHQFEGGIALSGSAVLRLSNATVQLATGAPFSVTGSAVVEGTCASGVPNWSGFAFIQPAGSAAWTIEGSASFRPDGRINAPGAGISVLDSAALTVRSAVVRSAMLGGNARVRFTSDIPEVALPNVPGRAKVVK